MPQLQIELATLWFCRLALNPLSDTSEGLLVYLFENLDSELKFPNHWAALPLTVACGLSPWNLYQLKSWVEAQVSSGTEQG